MLKLTDELRAMLKRPIGELYAGDFEPNKMEEIEGARLFVCVGDIVSYYALKSGLKPDIIVIDRKTKRVVDKFVSSRIDNLTVDYETVFARNPPSHLTVELVNTIIESLKILNFMKVKIIVVGEEDLSVLPLVCTLPEGSLIIYGQPDEGVVAVKVTDEKKIKIHQILSKMENVNGNGDDVLRLCKSKNESKKNLEV